MPNKFVVAGAGITLLALMVWWLTSGPTLIISLETNDRKSSLTYHCTVTSDAAEAVVRAKAAHLTLQARLSVYAKDAAAKAIAALDAYEKYGVRSNFDMLRHDTAELRALKAEIKREYGCSVDAL